MPLFAICSICENEGMSRFEIFSLFMQTFSSGMGAGALPD